MIDIRLVEALMEAVYVPKLRAYMLEKGVLECRQDTSNVFDWTATAQRDLEAKGYFDYPRPPEDMEKIFELEERDAHDAVYLEHYMALLEYAQRQGVFTPQKDLLELRGWKKIVIISSTIRKLMIELGHKDIPEFADFYPSSKVLC